jgi:DNA-binding response OmpR family regulator
VNKVPKILLIEDDQSLVDIISRYLQKEGYSVYWAEDGLAGNEYVSKFQPDLIILDIMLPGLDGLSLCSKIRKSLLIPILIISAKNKVTEKVEGLAVGADDYLCKPFSMNELVARVKSLLRRANYHNSIQSPATTSTTLRKIYLDEQKKTLYVDQETREITYSEFEILKAFLNNPGKVFTRDELLLKIKGIDHYLITDRAIDVHITNLRKKIERDPRKPSYIKTVWGSGYKFVLNGM